MAASFRSLVLGAFVGTASLLAATSAYAVPVLTFTGIGTGGTITYSGTDGDPLVGSGIGISSLLATGTIADGTYTCVDCFLNFTTGGNTLEGPPTWTYAAGGSYTITGAVDGIPGSGPTLLSGTFSDISTLTSTGISPNAVGTLAFGGTDSKDPTLAAFFGVSPTDWSFGGAQVTFPSTVIPSTGAFSGNVLASVNVDIAAVPEPSTLGLLGGGLLALGLFTSWRRKRATCLAAAEDVATV
jgi:hypothetical protein